MVKLPVSAVILAVVSLGQAQGFGMDQEYLGPPLAPGQSVRTPPSMSVHNPLKMLGGYSPWFQGPNIFNLSLVPPEGCHVDQAFYMTRHGSRYPVKWQNDYWQEMQKRFSRPGYEVIGPLAFFPQWRVPYDHPDAKIGEETITGFKEAHDMGYTLRTRYPHLYRDGDKFTVWANVKSRVVDTARGFVRGYLGTASDDLGTVAVVDPNGGPGAVGNSLKPAAGCTALNNTRGKEVQGHWDLIWIPPILERLSTMVRGNLALMPQDVQNFPMLCGFESLITGRMSPFCNILTTEELRDWEYWNDMRYYYGPGPGKPMLEDKMMLPLLTVVLDLFHQGPNATVGKDHDGQPFHVPPLTATFTHDDDLTMFVSGLGVFDGEPPLPLDQRIDSRLFRGSHFSTMRGTAALERMRCGGVDGVPHTFVRVLLNDVVYPLPFCHDGPGMSCHIDVYSQYVADKYASWGNWKANCGVDDSQVPENVLGGTFLSDLTPDWIKPIRP